MIMAKDNAKTATENAINRKLDALRRVVTGLVTRWEPEISVKILDEAWKEEKDD